MFSGSMDNKVVHTLARLYRDLSIPVVLFNFRGVGASEGSYAQGIGEVDDLAAIVEWLTQNVQPTELELAGFSFGSYVAATAAMNMQQDPRLKRVILIAPPVHHFEFQSYANHNCPTVVVQGMADEVVPPEQVIDWVDHNESPIQLVQMDDTSHFFHRKLVALKQNLLDTLTS